MAAVLRNRSSVLTRPLAALLVAVAVGIATPGQVAAVLLDGVLVDVEGTIVTASDAGIAKGLGLFGLRAEPPSIVSADVQRLVDAWLIGAEAARLQISPSPAEMEAAWQAAADRVGGMDALRRWLDLARLDEAWVRNLVGDDLRRQRFIDVRFRAFVFVPDEEVTRAIGPGPHAAEVYEQAVNRLREERTARDLAAWLAEARGRAAIRTTGLEGAGLGVPFPLPQSDGEPALR